MTEIIRIEEEWESWEDEYGKWKKNGDIVLHVEPSQKWKDENPPIKVPPAVDEIKLLNERLAIQEQVIEELMFIIIPELTGGGI